LYQPYGCRTAPTAAAVSLHAGITVTELLRYATSNNLTVPLGVLPNYADLTIGGLLATSSHGIGRSGRANVVRLALLCDNPCIHCSSWHCSSSSLRCRVVQ
jgi:FAD/FMN-containing dehydrogenase